MDMTRKEIDDGFTDLENHCRKTFIEENERIDRVTLKLETESINWAEVDIGMRGHPARNIISMLEINRSYLMYSEDREKLKVKILDYGRKLVELKIITQEYLDDEISVHEAAIAEALAVKDNQ